MRRIGLLGGMSWESSLQYYRIINETVRERLGSRHSADCVLYSVDFEPVERLQHAGAWDRIAEGLGECARRLELCGAELLVICTNTMHKVADQLQRETKLELVHIVDCTAREIEKRGARKVGLLGTRFTMEDDFYLGRLEERHGITAIVPKEDERAEIHRIIYDELCCGILRDSSRRFFAGVIGDLAGRGAQGVILGCTEIPLLVKQEDSAVPVYDTTAIHARAAVERSLES